MKLVTVNETTAFNPAQVVMVSALKDGGTSVLLTEMTHLNVADVEPMHLVAQINQALAS